MCNCHRVWRSPVGLNYYPRIGQNAQGELAFQLSQRPSDPNHPYCHYCEESTYHEYDPYFHAWVCQTCFGGMIHVDKKDPLSVIRSELNSLALHVAKSGYNAEVKGKLREVAGRLQKLAEGS
jgi:hypothetical protein